MKKLLEVLQYGEHDIRFNTDVHPEKNPNLLPELTAEFALTMITKLWGGNETSVLAVIRSLDIADLAVSVNRKEMIRHLDEASAQFAQFIQDAKRQMERHGVKVMEFGPGIAPGKIKS